MESPSRLTDAAPHVYHRTIARRIIVLFGPLKLAFFVIAVATVVGASGPQIAQRRLIGEWRVARGEFGGKPIQASQLPSITIAFHADGRWIGTENGAASGEGTWRTDDAAVPAALDLTHTAGRDNGKTQLCVFGVAGDSLTLVLGMTSGANRPTKLATAEGPPYTVLYVFVRTK
jgi:uncharacterized protein (TIGR03067 family)